MRFTTLTLHPAIDRVYEVESLTPGALIEYRLRMEVAAGKGVNTARVLRQLGNRRVRAVCWSGKDDTRLFREALAREGVGAAIHARPDPTRVCLTILEKRTGRETHLKDVMAPPARSEEQALLAYLKSLSLKNDCVAVCGSAPAGTRSRTLGKVLAMLVSRARIVIADSSGPLLEQAGRARLDGIKGNGEEVGDWLQLGEPFDPRRDGHRSVLLDALRSPGRPRRRSASDKKPRSAVITLGAQGAAYACAEGMWVARPPDLKGFVSATGCGDAATGGWMWAIADSSGPEETVRRVVAAGSAKLFSEDPGKLDAARAWGILKAVKVARLA
jgi:1-phosphofructokinase family hexose kinase